MTNASNAPETPTYLDTLVCTECLVRPVVEFTPHSYDVYFICPVCGTTINPQQTASKAIRIWNSKQQYLARSVV